MTAWPFRVCLCFLSVAAALAGSCRRAKRPAGREVVLYCSADQVFAEQVVRAFEKQTNIRVLARYDTEAGKTVGLVQRIRGEAAAPAADVFWSSEVFHMIRLGRDGLLAPYHGEATKSWPSRYVGPGGLWHGFAVRTRVIAYSTQRVPAGEAPKKLEDLLEGRWKGRIAMARLEFGTTGGDVASWFAHYGPKRAREILAALRANDVMVVDGNSTAVRMVATGRVDVCMTDTDDVYAAQRNGWQVGMNGLDQNGKGALTIPNTAAVLRGAPHPDQARELMAFLLSEKTETMLVESDSHNTPIRPALAKRYPQYAVDRALGLPYGRIADHLPEAIRTAGEVFR